MLVFASPLSGSTLDSMTKNYANRDCFRPHQRSSPHWSFSSPILPFLQNKREDTKNAESTPRSLRNQSRNVSSSFHIGHWLSSSGVSRQFLCSSFDHVWNLLC